jgi:hypothetical protein
MDLLIQLSSEAHRDKDDKFQLKILTSSESSEISMAVACGMFLWFFSYACGDISQLPGWKISQVSSSRVPSACQG